MHSLRGCASEHARRPSTLEPGNDRSGCIQREACKIGLRPITSMPQRPDDATDPLSGPCAEVSRERPITARFSPRLYDRGVSEDIGDDDRPAAAEHPGAAPRPPRWACRTTGPRQTDVPEDGWRPRDVVGHLITGELTDWIERTQRILEHGTARCRSIGSTASRTKERDTDTTLDRSRVERFATAPGRAWPG